MTEASLQIFEYDQDPSWIAPEGHDARTTHWEYLISPSESKVERKFLPSTAAVTSSSLATTKRDWLCHYLIAVPKQVLKDLFLPIDYPLSVGKEYFAYQVCDSLQGLCSYLRGVVASSALLKAAGVGNAEATAMSAAMTWAMRDGLGMIGGLLFSYSASSLFDGYVKEFRLFADIINDVGLTLDMLAPSFPNHVLYITSAATISKVMCGISAGATKGSITQHFCRRGNMADLNAKEGTQETLVSLIGMILGVILANYLHQLEQAQLYDCPDSRAFSASAVSWIIFSLLTVIHVWINYIGVKLLHLKTLNAQRCQEALQDVVVATTSTNSNLDQALASIPSPENISESLWSSVFSMLYPLQYRGIVVGTRLHVLMRFLSLKELSQQLQGEERYVLAADRRKRIYVSLVVGATSQDEFRAFLHACILRDMLRSTATCDSAFLQARNRTRELCDKGLKLSLMERKGWEVQNRLYLGFGRWRIQPVTNKMGKKD
jgi:hypothetical protein